MRKRILILAQIFCLGVAPAILFAADRYVATNGGHVSGFTNWADAATNIQDAINVAGAPGHIWVSNGTYYLTNQISLTKGVTLQSVNGRDTTFINGNHPAYSTRCVSMNHASAVLDGFTIMNAYYTNMSGGVNGAGMLIWNGTVRNCNITGNVGDRGGGVQVRLVTEQVSIYNCNITSNSCITNGAFMEGAGLHSSIDSSGPIVISNCYFADNYAPYRGGGIFTWDSITVVNCTFRNNHADNAGGAFVVVCCDATFRNCLLVGNWAGQGGGFLASAGGIIQNCTIVSNNATTHTIGGARFQTYGIMDNCVIVSNTPENYDGSVSSTNTYNCTSPAMTGDGNITNEPAFANYAAGDYRLSRTSPCINAGTNQAWMIGAVDMDGHSRIDKHYGLRVDMGAYEYIPKGTIFSIGH